jgi:CAAX prenyl protease-like protein
MGAEGAAIPAQRPRHAPAWPLLVAFAIAGGLAAPWHPVMTPLAAAGAGVIGLIGISLWRWSRLPERVAPAGGGLAPRLLRYGLWMALGLGLGLVLLAVIRLGLEPMLPVAGARIAAAGRLPLWQRAAIIYVAAVGEELVFRLIFFSIVAGLVARLRRVPGDIPDGSAVWTATTVAALAFGLAHLPSWSGIGPGLRSLPFVVVTLNTLAGLALGYIFGARGIVPAMWTHAGADCAIVLIGPLTG